MSFDALAETLLKAGVAPRYVRRYARELEEHLDDLTTQQHASGYDGEDAALRARARLGEDGELVQAMLDQPGMRSWPARLPWLVFLLLPPILTAMIGFALYAAFYLVGNSAAKINAVLALSQSSLVNFSVAAMTAVNVLAVPVMAILLAIVARRQRLRTRWPLLGISLLLLATPMLSSHFGHNHHGRLALLYGLVIPGRWSQVMRYWQLMLSHALALLPAAWLIGRRKAA
jgi:hypothetical protein